MQLNLTVQCCLRPSLEQILRNSLNHLPLSRNKDGLQRALNVQHADQSQRLRDKYVCAVFEDWEDLLNLCTANPRSHFRVRGPFFWRKNHKWLHWWCDSVHKDVYVDLSSNSSPFIYHSCLLNEHCTMIQSLKYEVEKLKLERLINYKKTPRN